MTESQTQPDELLVLELRSEKPTEFLPPEQQPRPQDRRQEYFIEVD